MNDMYEWGHDRFMGIPQNTTDIQLKKSARQIYAEAFMEDEGNTMFMNQKRYYDDDIPEPKKSTEETEADVEVNLDE